MWVAPESKTTPVDLPFANAAKTADFTRKNAGTYKSIDIIVNKIYYQKSGFSFKIKGSIKF